MKRDNKNRAPLRAAEVESHPGHESVGEEKVARLNPPCRIRVRSVRRRLCDADGISAKAAIDGLVACGLLPDDSPQYVESVTYSQEKTNGEEFTEITLEEVC